MPESLPIDLQNLQKKVQSFIDDVLVNIESNLDPNLNQSIPNSILDEVRIRSIENGVWGLTQPSEFGGSEANILEMTVVFTYNQSIEWKGKMIMNADTWVKKLK